MIFYFWFDSHILTIALSGSLFVARLVWKYLKDTRSKNILVIFHMLLICGHSNLINTNVH